MEKIKEKNKSDSTFVGYLQVALAGISWGLGGLFIHSIGSFGLSAATTAFFSQFIAFVILAINLLYKQGLESFKLNKEQFIIVLVYGILCKGFLKLLYDTSLSLVGMGTGSILIYTAPIYATIISRFVLAEPITRRKIIAIIMNFLGCILVITLGDFSSLNANLMGLIFGLLSGFLYAMSSIVSKLSTGKIDPMVLVTYTMLASAIVLFPFSDFDGIWHNFASIPFNLLIIGYGIVSGALANALFLLGMNKGLDASRVPVVSSIEVVVANLAGVIILNERTNLVGIIGIVLMLLSIVVMNAKVKVEEDIVS